MKMQHVTIMTRCLEDSVKFYQEQVGLTIVRDMRDNPAHQIVFLANAAGEPCVELIANARTVLLFGIGSSLCVAKDTYLKFLRLDKPCVVNEDSHSQLLQARNATAQDVGIVFSYSGQTMEMIQCIKEMKAGGAPVIAVTRYYPSEVAQLADHVLYVAANESLFRNGAMSSRLSQLNVMDILYTAYASRNHEDTMRRLTKTHIYKPGDPEVLTQP